MDTLINWAYIVANALFILGLKMVGSADSSRRGNMLSLAMVATLPSGGLSIACIIDACDFRQLH